ncbi:hypothetical protein BO221_16510 [Archangium sp. Cb G35]|uniref:nucleotidyltransferase domain-containing protein n=1 Tax=Archangium sp. Cb G35 TaxID=1920190 RepID=UPI00093609B1|nr:nucleotidyltransferase [Archangium sp. Cb G35]OJT23603.1 hypothetical protein BO221_16510 [Archangium sp. Cb G35]
MADVQTQIVQFDEKIRLSWNNEEKTLREKRKIILERLRAQFDAMREAGAKIPSFSDFNQGSYKMDTGIHPAKGDYDIDVGLQFNCARSEYPNPVTLKGLVADALEGHTHLGTEIKLSCVTVKYMVDGVQAYHVDLAIYTYEDPRSATKRLFLAKGKRGSGEDDRWWEESDPQGLINWVEGRFQDPDQEKQFLRVIRCLKRWKSEKFKTDGNNAPSGIGLTVAAGQWFRPQVYRDAFAATTTFDDLKAMKALVDVMISRFVQIGWKQEDGSALYRLSVPVPVAPGTDIFERMTDGQMTTFRKHLLQLQDRLDEVTNEPDPVRACQLMRKDFGDDFPIPEKNVTGQIGGRAIASRGVSA